MNTFRHVLPALSLSLGVALSGHSDEAPAKPRVIATTDGEIDDRCTMIRPLSLGMRGL